MIGVLAPNTIDNLSKDALGRSTQNQKNNQPYILDLITLKRLFLQTIPVEIEVGGDTQLATVGTMGRNNPYYHYTGGEEVVKFSISWYANQDNLLDVISACKWLWSLSRADGDKYGIHPIQFSMGGMFKDSKYIMADATYKLRQFHREKGQMPCVALQDITLKKMEAGNATHETIRKIST